MGSCTKKGFLQLCRKLEVDSEVCPIISEMLHEVVARALCRVALEGGIWGLYRGVCMLIDVVFILEEAIQTWLFV